MIAKQKLGALIDQRDFAKVGIAISGTTVFIVDLKNRGSRS